MASTVTAIACYTPGYQMPRRHTSRQPYPSNPTNEVSAIARLEAVTFRHTPRPFIKRNVPSDKATPNRPLTRSRQRVKHVHKIVGFRSPPNLCALAGSVTVLLFGSSPLLGLTDTEIPDADFPSVNPVPRIVHVRKTQTHDFTGWTFVPTSCRPIWTFSSIHFPQVHRDHPTTPARETIALFVGAGRPCQ
jgi:hypothetical protein